MITERTDRNLEDRDGRSLVREKPETPAHPRKVRSAALVVDTGSHVDWVSVATALDYLRLLDVPVTVTYAVDDPSRLAETVWEALADGHDLIVLGGGDGSVNTVVNLLAHTDATLGLLPIGATNDFARTLGIPTDLTKACETVACGVVDQVDLGLAGDNYYVDIASVGPATNVDQDLSPQAGRAASPPAYPMAALQAYAGREPFTAGLDFPEGDHEPAIFDRLIQVAIRVERFYGEGLAMAPGSSARDTTLDVYAIESGDPVGLGRIPRGIRAGAFVDDGRVHHWRTRRVELLTEHHLPLNIDGELGTRTPKPFRIAPGALKVLVPPRR
ncbi:MAG: YegS/Rv2252/BmrU family lipid kinase [Rubrobacteraceae bacterium]